MANNRIQIKRTSVSGRAANTSTLTNAGELALNMTDGIMYSTNGSVVFEIGANNTTVNISNSINIGANLIANTTTVFVGNSTVNISMTSNFLKVSNSTFTANLNPSSLTIGNTIVNSSALAVNNNSKLVFSPLAGGANVYFIQQNDDNFVFYTSNTLNQPRPIWSIFANSATSAFSIGAPVNFTGANVNLGTTTLYANGGVGTAGQVLTSNGSATYWSTVSGGSGSVNTSAQYTWSNLHTFQANVAFTGNNISVVSNTGSIMFAGSSDTNWRIGRSTGSVTKLYYSNNSLDIIAADSNLEGVVIGKPGGNSYIETGYAGTFTLNPIFIGNSTVNSTSNSTQYQVANSTGTANLNPTSLRIGTAVVNTTTVAAPALTVSGISTFNANIVLGTSGLSSNGSFGTAGQVLSSNGTATYWSAAGNTTITVSNAAPSSPVNNQLWWNSDLGAMFIYYADANTSQWVETNPLGQFGVTAVQTVGITTGKAIAMAMVFGG